MDGHHCAYPSVTVSMDVTVAVTIHDYPWMDTVPTPVSMDVTVAMTIHDHPWMDTTVHTPLSQCPWMSR